MKRHIEADLAFWKKGDRRKPLILRGARQVGKTWAVEALGKAHFKQLVKIDLEKRPDLHGIFQADLAAKTILSQLSLVFGQIFVPGETLLFLDEIQACPRALMALRYLYEEMPELHVIAAGSLLEFELETISFPVGRVQFLNMYPMTFAEFVLAGGNEPLFNTLRQSATELGDAVHQSLLRQLKDYFFVGGMPEAVRAFYDTGSMLEAFEVQTEILDAYRQDFGKYAVRSDKDCLNQVLSNGAAKVGEQIKYSELATGFSNPTIHKAFDLLGKALVLHKIPAVKAPVQPLGSVINGKKFKAAFVDIGLMQRLAHLPVDVEIRHEDLLMIYRGRLAEQFVAQELLVTQNRELFYWSRAERGSEAEVDYLFQKAGRIFPIEVKSGKGGSLRSLHAMLQSYPDCTEGWVLYSGAYGIRPEQKLRFIPLYFAGSL